MTRASSFLQRFPLLFLAAMLVALAVFVFAPAPADAQSVPMNLQAEAGHAQVTVTWDTPVTGATQVEIQWGQHPSGTLSVELESAGNGDSTLRGLTNGQTYRFRARGYDGNTATYSAYTNWVTATPEAPPGTLVTNLGQTDSDSFFVTGAWSVAQAFTTGATSGGYTLGSIDIWVNAIGITETQRDSIRAELWSAATGGAPGSKVADLAVPAHPISSGMVSFAAPANTTLAASTTYYAVFYTVGDFNMGLDATTDNDEDSGSATGWSIANGARNSNVDEPTSTTTWSTPKLASLFITITEVEAAALDLSALTAESSTDGSTFSALTFYPAFDADTTSYTATVGSDVTHARLTPTLADATSSVKVGKAGTTLSPVTSGTASDPIALVVGDNEITVEVTAADSTTQDYTVNVRHTTVWSATFTVGGTQSQPGCSGINVCNSQLSDNSFEVGGQQYSITSLTYEGGSIISRVSADKNAALQALKFCVGSTGLDFPDSTGAISIWSSPGVSWSPGDTVSLSIGTACVQGTASTNANLSGLTASSSTSAGGAFSALALTPAFDADTLVYSATVANSITHVKLTPTVADSGAAVTVGGSPVTSGTASAAQPVSVGSTGISVEVTAEDGSTEKVYQVGIEREAAAVSLSASPSTVDEGSSVTVTATLDTAQSGDVTIPIAVTGNSADSGDYGTLTSITISGGSTTGTGSISTTQDTNDESDETFTVSLGSLPSGITAGDPSSVEITIRDDDTTTTPTPTPTPTTPKPTVSLSVDTNSVREGSSVTVTATLSETRSSATVVHLDMRAGTAESGDYGTLASITIPANMTTGTGAITTTADADTDDEVFHVALKNVTADAGYAWGAVSWLDITILDGGLRRVTLSVGPNPVPEGDDVTVVATLSTASAGEPGTLGRNVTIPITLTAGSAETTDYSKPASITITAGDITGEATISTTDDAADDDETFTVALGDLSTVRGVTTGPITSVQVRITDNDAASPGTLSVDTGFGNPACGSTVSVLTETPETALVLSPAPAAEVQTEYRVLADENGRWLAGVPILTTGSSVFTSSNTYAGLLEAYPGFRGFEYRLADHANVTASCTWTFQTGGV